MSTKLPFEANNPTSQLYTQRDDHNSTDLVGSSKNMIGGLLTNSRAIDSRLRCPPDRLAVLVLFESSRLRLLKISSTCTATHRAAHLITGARRRDHITPVLCQLHWLLVRRRVETHTHSTIHSTQQLTAATPLHSTHSTFKPHLT